MPSNYVLTDETMYLVN